MGLPRPSLALVLIYKRNRTTSCTSSRRESCVLVSFSNRRTIALLIDSMLCICTIISKDYLEEMASGIEVILEWFIKIDYEGNVISMYKYWWWKWNVEFVDIIGIGCYSSKIFLLDKNFCLNFKILSNIQLNNLWIKFWIKGFFLDIFSFSIFYFSFYF